MANKTIKAKLVQLNGTASQLSQDNPMLLKGQIALEIDTHKIKVGDGLADYNSLPYWGADDGGSNEDAMPLTGGTFTGVVTAYSNTNYGIGQIRNIYISTALPTDSVGGEGDVWIQI